MRAREVLLMSAVGDALGAPVEFKRRFTKRDVLRAYDGRVTDDTQMHLATANALAWTVPTKTAEGTTRRFVRHAWIQYLDWYEHQSLPYYSRAPGNTCLSALRYSAMARIRGGVSKEYRLNSSDGCGGVMRTAVIGCDLRIQDPYDAGRRAAGLTHGGPNGFVPAGALAEIIRALVQGSDLRIVVRREARALWERRNADEDTRATELALWRALAGDRPLGEGWDGVSALEIAVHACLHGGDTPHDILLEAVTHDGDSDSTGAIAGAILGAQGLPIPPMFLKKLEPEYRTWAEQVGTTIDAVMLL